MIKAVILDMDGLMFDSEKLSLDVLNSIMEEYHTSFPIEGFYKMMGATPDEIKKVFLKYVDPEKYDVSYEELMSKYQSKMKQSILLTGMPMKTGLLVLLDYLKENKIKMAVASSSSHQVIENYLKMNKIETYFDCIIGHEDITKSKPNPEIFLKSAKELHIESQHCLVLEDSDRGLRAAQAAEMANIWIPDVGKISEETKSKTSRVYDNLAQVIEYLKEVNN